MTKSKRRKNKKGYVLILCPDHPYCISGGYVLEHKLVVEKKIGRYLTKEEVVHHRDEDKTNNSIENLRVFKTQKDHMAWHVKLKKFPYLTKSMRREEEQRWENV